MTIPVPTAKTKRPLLSLAEVRAKQRRRTLHATAEGKQKTPAEPDPFRPPDNLIAEDAARPAESRSLTDTHQPTRLSNSTACVSQDVSKPVGPSSPRRPARRIFQRSVSLQSFVDRDRTAARTECNPFFCTQESPDAAVRRGAVPPLVQRPVAESPFALLKTMSMPSCRSDDVAGRVQSQPTLQAGISSEESEEDEETGNSGFCADGYEDDYDVDDGGFCGSQCRPLGDVDTLSSPNRDGEPGSTSLDGTCNSEELPPSLRSLEKQPPPADSHREKTATQTRLFNALEAGKSGFQLPPFRARPSSLSGQAMPGGNAVSGSELLTGGSKARPCRTDEDILNSISDAEDGSESVANSPALSRVIKPEMPPPGLPSISTMYRLDRSFYTSNRPPLDWSLPRTLTFTSSKPFEWCHSPNAYQESMALAAFVTNAPTQAQSNVSECEAEQLACDFQRALYSWQFPLAQPSPHQAAAIVRFLSRTRSGQHIYGKKGDALASELGDDRAEYEQFKARETQWRQAFRSLYYSMRQAVEVDRVPETRHFYVIADEFSVLFRARIGSSSFSAVSPGVESWVASNGESGKYAAEFEAVITRSTRGLRQKLEEDGVPFSMPLKDETTGILRAAGAPEVKADVDSEAESDRSLGHFVLETPTKASRAPVNASVETAIPESLVAAIKSRQSKGVSGATSPSPKDQLDMNHDGLVVRTRPGDPSLDNSVRSALLFSGHRGIHGLFDFLLNWKGSKKDARARSIPTLISPAPFRNGALRKAEITKNGSVKRAGREAATGKAALETQHVLEIAGPLLPGQIERLLNVLALRRTGRSAVGFKLAKTAEPLTVGCNVGSLAAAAAMAPEDERGNDRGLPGQDSRDSGPAPASFAKSWVSALEWDAGAQPPDASEDPQRHARFRWSLGKA